VVLRFRIGGFGKIRNPQSSSKNTNYELRKSSVVRTGLFSFRNVGEDSRSFWEKLQEQACQKIQGNLHRTAQAFGVRLSGLDGQQVHFDGEPELQVVAGHLQGEGMRGETSGGELTWFQDSDFARTPAEIRGIHDQDGVRFFPHDFFEEIFGDDACVYTASLYAPGEFPDEKGTHAVISPGGIPHAEKEGMVAENLFKLCSQEDHPPRFVVRIDATPKDTEAHRKKTPKFVFSVFFGV
jgi:hypothetical protein